MFVLITQICLPPIQSPPFQFLTCVISSSSNYFFASVTSHPSCYFVYFVTYFHPSFLFLSVASLSHSNFPIPLLSPSYCFINLFISPCLLLLPRTPSIVSPVTFSIPFSRLLPISSCLLVVLLLNFTVSLPLFPPALVHTSISPFSSLTNFLQSIKQMLNAYTNKDDVLIFFHQVMTSLLAG